MWLYPHPPPQQKYDLIKFSSTPYVVASQKVSSVLKYFEKMLSSQFQLF